LIVLLLILSFPWTSVAAGPASFQDFRDYLIGSTPLTVSLADVNKDSYPDAIVGSYSGTLLLLGRSDGTFGSPSVVQKLFASSVAVADFNHDGNLDIVPLASANSSLLNLALGNGNGTFQPARTLPVDCTYCQSLTTGDFNNDGKPDLAV